MRRRGLAALLVYAQESHFYLTGFDTSGYVFYQVGIITADARPTLVLTRRPDQFQALDASLYDDVRLWYNAEDANPAGELKAILLELGLAGERVGIELATYGLTPANWRATEAELSPGFRLEDASDLVRRLRLSKSPAEIDMMRSSARVCDEAVRAIVAAARPGVLDSAATAAGVARMLELGSDMPAMGPLVNSGPRAIYGRGIGGPRVLEDTDTVMIELAASWCRYHTILEHTVVIGRPDPRQERMHAVVAEAMREIVAHARPGRRLGELDDIHRRVLDAGGYAQSRFSACGYAIGATFRPSWMDVPPMIYSGNPLVMEPGMAFFVHVLVADRAIGLAAGVGQSFIVTEGEAEVLSRLPLDLFRQG
jgi:Xaa-Pro dipeptidase